MIRPVGILLGIAATMIAACQTGGPALTTTARSLTGSDISGAISAGFETCTLFSESDLRQMANGANATPTTTQRDVVGGAQCEWFVEGGPTTGPSDSNMSIAYSCSPEADRATREILAQYGTPVDGTISGAQQIRLPGAPLQEGAILVVDECSISSSGLERVSGSGAQMLTIAYERLVEFIDQDPIPQ